MDKQIVSLRELPNTNDNGNRAFLYTFEPEAIGLTRRFGFFKRKSVEIKINLLTLKDIISRISKKNKEVQLLIRNALSKPSEERRLFFYQPNILLGQEHFVLIVSDEEYSLEDFKNHSVMLAMNKHFWKVAQNNNIVVVLDADDVHTIYINDKEYRYGVFQKYIREYANLHSVLDMLEKNAKSPSIIDVASLIRTDKDLPSMLLFSDLHIADKTPADNFGSTKEKRLVEMLNTIPKEVPVIVPGDVFELWQSKPKKIEASYSGKGSLLESFSKMENLILLAGNHDEDIFENEKHHKWASSLLPRASILQNAIITSKNMDIIAYHGDKQDSANNHTVFGRTVAKTVGFFENKITHFINPETGQSSLEEKSMNFLRHFLAPTPLLVKSDIMRNIASFITDINLFLYWRIGKLSDLPKDVQRKVAIIIGHTHKLIRHFDNDVSQIALSLLIGEFIDKTPEEGKTNKSYLIDKLNIKYINLGTGAGESECSDVKEKSSKKLDNQNSTWIYENGDLVSIAYTKSDYCGLSFPVAF